MSDNVGLSTPRGSGTSGFVQRNLAYVRPRDRAAPYPPKENGSFQHRPRRADKNFLAHERNRELYRKEFEYRIELLDELDKEEEESAIRPTIPIMSNIHSLDEEEQKEIKKKVADYMENEKKKEARGAEAGSKRQFKGHEVHQMADAKLKDMERIGKALKIPRDYEEGSHWRRQEERMKSSLERDGRDERETSRD